MEISQTLRDDDEHRREFRKEIPPHVLDCHRSFPCLHRCLSWFNDDRRHHQNQLDQKEHAEKVSEEINGGHLT